jgi:hypothetical protein
MNFLAIAQSPNVDQAVGLDAGVDQLAEPGDAEARRQHGLDQPAAQSGGHAHHQVDLVLLGQPAPAGDDVAVVLRRLGVPGRVVHAVVIEEHALHLVPLGDRRGAEEIRGVGRLVLVRPLVDQDCNLHLPSCLRSGCGSRR